MKHFVNLIFLKGIFPALEMITIKMIINTLWKNKLKIEEPVYYWNNNK